MLLQSFSRCVSAALPGPASPNSRIVIVRAATVRDSVYHTPSGATALRIIRLLNGLCNLDNALDVALDKVARYGPTNFDLRATGEEECAVDKESES